LTPTLWYAIYLSMEIDKVSRDVSESPISFILDGNSGQPTYMQIVQQTENALRLGHLQIGDRLPRVKDVVAGLAINPNTVLKAYRELESRGYVAGKQGIGTFVLSTPAGIELKHYVQLQKSLNEGWLSEARSCGLDNESILAIIQNALLAQPINREKVQTRQDRELA